MKQSAFAASLAMALSLGVALAVFGLRIANPYDVSWIATDAVTSQFGWDLYRADPAHLFPIVSDRYSWPLPMPLALFDNLPLIALLVKIIAPATSAPIQYFGPLFLIGMLCHALFAFALLREATGRRTDRAYLMALVLGTLFLTTAPILLWRFGFSHMSLSQQWPLIASLWLYARSNRVELRRSLRDFTILEFVSSSINPYIMAMTLMIYFGLIVKCFVDKTINFKNSLYFVVPVLIGALALVISGFVNPLGGTLIAGEGYGFFSANLFSPFNPMSHYFGSALLPDLAVSTAGQYEGFGYLGLGGLLLLGGGLIYARIRGENGGGLFPPLLVVAFLAYLLAVSAHFSFGIYSFDVSLPHWLFNLLAVFRSSGRFIWVSEYSLLFIAIASLIRLLKPGHAAAILAAAAMVQAVDLAAPLSAMHQRFAQLHGSQRFTDAAYQGLGAAHDTLVVLPAWQCEMWNETHHDYPWEQYVLFSNLASDNHLRTNSFYAGRTPVAQARYHCITAPEAIEKQPAEPRTAYLLSKYMFREHGAHIAATHFCDFAEDMFICRGDRGQTGLSPRARQAAASLADVPVPDTYKP